MAKTENSIIFSIKIKPDLSLRDALKLRLAGGKYMMNFWDGFAKNVSIFGKKVRRKRHITPGIRRGCKPSP